MCGIIGYIGPKNALNILLEGLHRLEYRGYDSAGVCLQDDSQELVVYKEVGKIENLEKSLKDISVKSHLGIGHTRWATHGKVTQTNAHPHNNQNLAIVHNGIIENSSELREKFQNDGLTFASETDSEVFLILVNQFFTHGKSLRESVSEAFKHIKGNSAFAVINREQEEIVAIKRGVPLVCGVSEDLKEAFVSSDVHALHGKAAKLYFPEDEVVCSLQEKALHFYELDGQKSKRFALRQGRSQAHGHDKEGFDHFMLKEIHEQPRLILNLLDYYRHGEGKSSLVEASQRAVRHLHLMACGTAWHAGLIMRDFFEKFNKVPTFVELASEFRYGNPLLLPGDMGIFISQSGETADTLASLELCRKRRITALSIVNVEESTLFRQSDLNLQIRAGMEIGVASTKAFTLQVITGYLLSKAMAFAFPSAAIEGELVILARRIEELLKQSFHIESIAKEIHQCKGFLFTGRGLYFPIALEGALKLKEISYRHAEGYATGELKHGPIALVDNQMVNVSIMGPDASEKAMINMEEVKARGGIILGIGPKDKPHLTGTCDYFIPLNYEGLDDLGPLYANVACQLLAYYVAKLGGKDIDRPRNLAKSVTVE